MGLSPFFEDSDIVSQIRGFFDVDKQWTIDFDACLSTVEDYDDENLCVTVEDRLFIIHTVAGVVSEDTGEYYEEEDEEYDEDYFDEEEDY